MDLEWPAMVHSLSHVALPFAPDDPTYGAPCAREGGPPALLGNLMLRSERGALALPADELLRLRHDPFHAYLGRVIVTTLAGER